MDKSEIIRKIEDFAPPELAESWDCSGWLVETAKTKNKTGYALSDRDRRYYQAGARKKLRYDNFPSPFICCAFSLERH